MNIEWISLPDGESAVIKGGSKPRCVAGFEAFSCKLYPAPKNVMLYCINRYGVGRLGNIQDDDIGWYPLPASPSVK